MERILQIHTHEMGITSEEVLAAGQDLVARTGSKFDGWLISGVSWPGCDYTSDLFHPRHGQPEGLTLYDWMRRELGERIHVLFAPLPESRYDELNDRSALDPGWIVRDQGGKGHLNLSIPAAREFVVQQVTDLLENNAPPAGVWLLFEYPEDVVEAGAVEAAHLTATMAQVRAAMPQDVGLGGICSWKASLDAGRARDPATWMPLLDWLKVFGYYYDPQERANYMDALANTPSGGGCVVMPGVGTDNRTAEEMAVDICTFRARGYWQQMFFVWPRMTNEQLLLLEDL